MGMLINEADIAYVQALYPMLRIEPFTGQEENFLWHLLRGDMKQHAAAKAVGMTATAARQFLEREDVQKLMDYVRAQMRHELGITRETVSAMFLESYSMAATSAEMTAAARELAKLHGLYEADEIAREAHEKKMAADEDAADAVATTAKKLRRLNDGDLVKLISRGAAEGDDFDLFPTADEADFEEVDDGPDNQEASNG